MKRTFVLCLFLGGMVLSAASQPIVHNCRLDGRKYPSFKTPELPTVTVEEMCQRFYETFGKPSTARPTDYDALGIRQILVGESPLATCPQVQEAATYRGLWDYDLSGGADMYLCLQALQKAGTEQNEDGGVLRRMKAAYPEHDGLVRAEWFSGLLGRMEHPMPYMGFVVSPNLSFVRVDKGLVKNEMSWLHNGPSYLSEAAGLRSVSDAHWADYADYEMILFTHDVNRDWRTCQLASASSGEKLNCSLLLTTDDNGALTVHPLLPKELAAGQQELLKRLQTVLSGLPAWSFQRLYTADGRVFPGRYVEAVYHTDSNTWRFLNYIRSSTGRISEVSPLSAFGIRKWE